MGPGVYPDLQIRVYPRTHWLWPDALGTLGLKLDSSPDRVNSGLLPVKDDGRAADDYSRLGLTFKARLSSSELKVGELQPNLPVLAFSDIRLLPPSYQGLSLSSNEITGLTLQAGHLSTTSLRNEAGDGKMIAMLGHVPQRGAQSDAFNYVGGDYAFNRERTSVSLWHGQLQDIYAQDFIGLKHSQPFGTWVLGANLGYYTAREEGEQLLGKIDNQAFFSLLSARRGGHTFYVGYQAMYGDSAFPGYLPMSRHWVTKSPPTSLRIPTSAPGRCAMTTTSRHSGCRG